MLISGFGRSGHAVGDIPGVRFKVSLVMRLFYVVVESFRNCLFDRL